MRELRHRPTFVELVASREVGLHGDRRGVPARVAAGPGSSPAPTSSAARVDGSGRCRRSPRGFRSSHRCRRSCSRCARPRRSSDRRPPTRSVHTPRVSRRARARGGPRSDLRREYLGHVTHRARTTRSPATTAGATAAVTIEVRAAHVHHLRAQRTQLGDDRRLRRARHSGSRPARDHPPAGSGARRPTRAGSTSAPRSEPTRTRHSRPARPAGARACRACRERLRRDARRRSGRRGQSNRGLRRHGPTTSAVARARHPTPRLPPITRASHTTRRSAEGEMPATVVRWADDHGRRSIQRSGSGTVTNPYWR